MSLPLRWRCDVATPVASLAAEHTGLLAAAAATETGWLRVFTIDGDVLSVGAHQRTAPSIRPAAGVAVMPRPTGGRIVPCGAGFIGVALALPHRSALVDGAVLAPEQALNRCVRGVMGALDGLGFATFYPGRDLLTHDGRPFAMVTLTTQDDGAALFEAVVAIERDFALLPSWLDRVDPDGVWRAPLWMPADVVAVAPRLGRVPGLDELTAAIVAAYRKTFAVVVEPAPSALPPAGPPPSLRAVPPDLDRQAASGTMLGALGVYARVVDGRFDAVMLCGDLITPASTIAAIESRLRGVPVRAPEVTSVLEAVLAEPAHFLLGAGSPAEVATAIAGVGR